jgi:hypothetical protein
MVFEEVKNHSSIYNKSKICNCYCYCKPNILDQEVYGRFASEITRKHGNINL